MEDGQGQQKCNTKLPTTTMESKDCNLIDFMTKKEDKNKEDAAIADPNADGTCNPTTHEKDNDTVLEEPEPHQTQDNNSSSVKFNKHKH